ncbi:MarR family winged helix-turn-helix transcriptional regulator [Paenibacillus pinihumi]|uniref:MarR family winged helix-turn-helix transcriptional regulator n=1 Tax=Paenibacillus pinihumi TaxID=669462 RepID=UPI0003FEBCC0|nr:MarR family transcriptional regulator [Paenibacillus pinihumi]
MEQHDIFLKLEQHLCFVAYACSKEMTKLYRPILDEFGLTYTQYITMVVLWEKNELPMKELGSRLYLDSGTLTPLLKKLEAMGLITRNRDKQDERSVVIGLTAIGTELKEKAKNIPLRLFNQTDVSEDKLMQIHTQMNDLLNMLEGLDTKQN